MSHPLKVEPELSELFRERFPGFSFIESCTYAPEQTELLMRFDYIDKKTNDACKEMTKTFPEIKFNVTEAVPFNISNHKYLFGRPSVSCIVSMTFPEHIRQKLVIWSKLI